MQHVKSISLSLVLKACPFRLELNVRAVSGLTDNSAVQASEAVAPMPAAVQDALLVAIAERLSPPKEDDVSSPSEILTPQFPCRSLSSYTLFARLRQGFIV